MGKEQRKEENKRLVEIRQQLQQIAKELIQIDYDELMDATVLLKFVRHEIDRAVGIRKYFDTEF